MVKLPVREIVLYKHGVGFFVREGKTSASEITLTFRRDEINDVLKSLAVFDKAGGQVLGIHYQTPMDTQSRLANSSIRLSNTASLRDLLRDLRGRKVALTFEVAPGSMQETTGRIIGIDAARQRVDAEDEQKIMGGAVSLDALNPLATQLISLLDEKGQVQVFRFDQLRSVSIHDSQSEHDLTYFLDTSTSEESRRAVNVRLNKGKHELVVHYVAPSPTWRVTYRVVAQSDDGSETGAAHLQGWGLFDNRFEEDLEDVKVTLVAGQPISFVYDLYGSKIPQRPTVADESRVAPGPVEYAGESFDLAAPDWLMEAAEKEPARPTSAPLRQIASQPLGVTSEDRTRLRRDEMAKTVPAAADTREAGEFFQYVVNTPVSVKRGESALVPIISSEVKYERELLYNGIKLPRHPVASLRFYNATGLTLERGPVTVVENGDYKGEALISFTKDKNQVYLPYAVELGMTVTENRDTYSVTTGLKIKDGFAIYEEYQIHQVIYKLENTSGRALTVRIEAPIIAYRELFDTPQPETETAKERRWRVRVPARERVDFICKERQLTKRQQELRRLEYADLDKFLEQRWLDKPTITALRVMLDALALIQQAQDRIRELEGERKSTHEQQEQLRANMQALSPTGDEAAFRKRIVGQLESSQDRLDEIAGEIETFKRQALDSEEKVKHIIAGLGE